MTEAQITHERMCLSFADGNAALLCVSAYMVVFLLLADQFEGLIKQV